jgi:hypothetical protein
VRLRCYLFRYSLGGEAIRWFLEPRPDGWAQQVMVQRLPGGDVTHTGDDPSAVVYMPGLPDLLEDGKVEEL